MSKPQQTRIARAILAASIALAPAAQAALQEVIISARKVDEPLQQVPLSVNALGEQALANRGVASLKDLTLSVPSLQAYDFPTTTTNISLFMRGFGNTDSQTLTIDNPIGVYLDGAYLPRTSGATIDVLDLERVEILRGPQGTLFGRNSSAGTVQFITRKPGDEFAAKVKVGGGNFGAWDFNASVDLPVSDVLSTKVSYFQSNFDGWVENKGPNSVGDNDAEDFYLKEQEAYRAALRFQPHDALTIDYAYDFSEVDSAPLYYQADASERQEETSNVLVGGGAFEYVLPLSNNESEGHNLTIDVALTDTLSVKSITTYRELFESAIQNWSDTLTFGTELEYDTETVTQEFQLTGSAKDGQLNYVAGVYYFKEDGTKSETQSSNFDGMMITSPDVFIGGFSLGENSFETEAESVAVYAQASMRYDSGTGVTVGLRYTEDERSAERTPDANPFNPFAAGSNDLDYEQVDWLVTVDQDIADDVNVYARIATGYRAGGSAERAENFSQTFDPEEVISYELGLKSEFLDNRLRVNVAAFASIYDDFILTISGLPPLDASKVEVFNAGEAEIIGLELDVLAQFTDRTTLSANYAALDTELKDLIVPETSELRVDLRGMDISDDTFVAFAPKNALTVAIDHSVPMDFAELDVHLNYAWRDELFSQPTAGLPVDELALVNGRVGFSGLAMGDDIKLDVHLWGKNLLDTERVVYNLSGFGFQFNQPRTYGISIAAEL